MAILPPLTLALGGVSLLVAASDRLSKRLARPGVANEGLPGLTDSSDGQAVAPASLPPGSARKLVVVFGATGGSGLAIVQVALEKGYCVRAFVRNPRKLQAELQELAEHEHLEVVEGDLRNLEAVKDAIEGAVAVISAAGAQPETAPGPMAAAIPAIVEGCRKCGVQKLIVQACALSAVPGEWWGLITQGRLARAVVRWQLSSNVIDDNERVMQYLYREVRDLAWVVTRPTWLEDGERSGPLAPNMDAFKPCSLRYLDLADWTLAQLECNTYVGKMPRLCYPPVIHPI
ncbi:unnamed protein product [Polarella glacialis]|uniref:NAD(P)-binding domain-containing protein n=1 Tax=Polarella glacialis TaxID=89957 RepID=A0A813IUJ8_POLGL|nr:unnamed protein product [Polarella glacialis]CAE8655989.1 unnamed protein product [Polarella glacialis]